MNIEQLVNDFLKHKQEQSNKDHGYTGLINASLLCQCHRRQFYAIQKIEVSNPIEERTLRVFACGDLFHEFLQNIMTKSTTGLPEQSYKNDLVSVRADFVDDESVYELKSQHSRKFFYINDELKKGKSIIEIAPDHVFQVILCAKCFNKKIAHLVYISKDDLCIKQFTFNVTELLPRVEEEVAKIKQMLDYGQLPPPEPRLYGKDSGGHPKECSYCNWKSRCATE